MNYKKLNSYVTTILNNSVQCNRWDIVWIHDEHIYKGLTDKRILLLEINKLKKLFETENEESDLYKKSKKEYLKLLDFFYKNKLDKIQNKIRPCIVISRFGHDITFIPLTTKQSISTNNRIELTTKLNPYKSYAKVFHWNTINIKYITQKDKRKLEIEDRKKILLSIKDYFNKINII